VHTNSQFDMCTTKWSIYNSAQVKLWSVKLERWQLTNN
jgi:hypothetical protein